MLTFSFPPKFSCCKDSCRRLSLPQSVLRLQVLQNFNLQHPSKIIMLQDTVLAIECPYKGYRFYSMLTFSFPPKLSCWLIPSDACPYLRVYLHYRLYTILTFSFTPKLSCCRILFMPQSVLILQVLHSVNLLVSLQKFSCWQASACSTLFSFALRSKMPARSRSVAGLCLFAISVCYKPVMRKPLRLKGPPSQFFKFLASRRESESYQGKWPI